ncbi:MAG: methylaspartate mutase accessory protein GlmL [Oscillospiraceae bacterium]|nr:methylaspartate mutase accessory protein GlmL [Oscillospiraceae bacterium]
MKPVLLVDIGSTYTKVVAVDLAEPRILGTAASHTTVERDVALGLNQALANLEAKTGRLDFIDRLACSSAAGGLRMVASGLTPSLTEKAALMACLGAGAKVVRSFTYALTEQDAAEIKALRPDIFLLSGGTDGGNDKVITHNAGVLAAAEVDFPIVLAGNQDAVGRCQALLSGREVYTTGNIMPRLEQLCIGPVQDQVRAVFLDRIIQAKGLGPVAEQMTLPLIPTPAAVLLAMELLALGTDGMRGIGELVAVDLGGATTDVYSIAVGEPTVNYTLPPKGIQEPFAKRTVEGDIGMRYSAAGIIDAVGIEWVVEKSGIATHQVEALVRQFGEVPDTLPNTPELAALDRTLASAALKTAVARHAGTVATAETYQGSVLAQTGKDLMGIKHLIVIGGAIIHSPVAGEVAKSALFDSREPASLRPKQADIYIDRNYVVASLGLLSQKYPREALTLMKQELKAEGGGARA